MYFFFIYIEFSGRMTLYVGKDILHMIINNNSFGQDPTDYNEKTAASRVGDRIRKIRIEKRLSQSELGDMVGLTADRIQKYENGARKPKADLLKKISDALGVSPLALTDPVTTNYTGAMYAMFELENTFNMKIEKSGEDETPAMRLTVDFREHLYEYMKEWYDIYSHTQAELKAASSDVERDEIMKSYHNWQWTFPQGITNKTERGLQKERIRRKIEELQEAYDMLDGETDQN